MTVIFIKTTFVVAVDVGDHYDGVTDLEVAEAAALDQDIVEWLHNDMTAVECSDHDVIVEGHDIDTYAEMIARGDFFAIKLGPADRTEWSTP